VTTLSRLHEDIVLDFGLGDGTKDVIIRGYSASSPKDSDGRYDVYTFQIVDRGYIFSTGRKVDKGTTTTQLSASLILVDENLSVIAGLKYVPEGEKKNIPISIEEAREFGRINLPIFANIADTLGKQNGK
jgi:hypothetical protein